MSEQTTLGDEYPKQQARCRELLRQYEEVRKHGAFVDFAVGSINAILKEADEAAISGDLPRMIRAFAAMKECA